MYPTQHNHGCVPGPSRCDHAAGLARAQCGRLSWFKRAQCDCDSSFARAQQYDRVASLTRAQCDHFSRSTRAHHSASECLCLTFRVVGVRSEIASIIRYWKTKRIDVAIVTPLQTTRRCHFRLAMMPSRRYGPLLCFAVFGAVQTGLCLFGCPIS